MMSWFYCIHREKKETSIRIVILHIMQKYRKNPSCTFCLVTSPTLLYNKLSENGSGYIYSLIMKYPDTENGCLTKAHYDKQNDWKKNIYMYIIIMRHITVAIYGKGKINRTRHH